MPGNHVAGSKRTVRSGGGSKNKLKGPHHVHCKWCGYPKIVVLPGATSGSITVKKATVIGDEWICENCKKKTKPWTFLEAIEDVAGAIANAVPGSVGDTILAQGKALIEDPAFNLTMVVETFDNWSELLKDHVSPDKIDDMSAIIKKTLPKDMMTAMSEISSLWEIT